MILLLVFRGDRYAQGVVLYNHTQLFWLITKEDNIVGEVDTPSIVNVIESDIVIKNVCTQA